MEAFDDFVILSIASPQSGCYAFCLVNDPWVLL